jgi:hypothetical protein
VQQGGPARVIVALQRDKQWTIRVSLAVQRK